MSLPGLSLRRFARLAAAGAALTGGYGFLLLMGAFGPVSCWTSRTTSQDSGSSEAATAVSRGCEAGIDYLLRGAGGNAPVLFFWAVVLLALTALGVFGVWAERRAVVWTAVVGGTAITIIGVFSIGWSFLFPTLFLFTAATALSVDARRDE